MGYRQVWDYLDGKLTAAEMQERGIIATRQLAKRQMTWLRAMPRRHLVPVDAGATSAALRAQVLHHLLEHASAAA